MRPIEKAVANGMKAIISRIMELQKEKNLSDEELDKRIKKIKPKDYEEQFTEALFMGFTCKALRRKRNWTQQQLAEKCEVSCTRISQFETANPKAGMDILFRVCFVMKISVADYMQVMKDLQKAYYKENPPSKTSKKKKKK